MQLVVLQLVRQKICLDTIRTLLIAYILSPVMYTNRLMYKSLQASNNTFFTQVLFCIDRALQIHWHSCCEGHDRDSVNDRVLLMQDKRDLIIQHNFSYHLPKLLKN